MFLTTEGVCGAKRSDEKKHENHRGEDEGDEEINAVCDMVRELRGEDPKNGNGAESAEGAQIVGGAFAGLRAQFTGDQRK